MLITHQLSPPRVFGLYDPRNEHDACGVALVLKLWGEANHVVVDARLLGISSTSIARLPTPPKRTPRPNCRSARSNSRADTSGTISSLSSQSVEVQQAEAPLRTCAKRCCARLGHQSAGWRKRHVCSTTSKVRFTHHCPGKTVIDLAQVATVACADRQEPQQQL